MFVVFGVFVVFDVFDVFDVVAKLCLRVNLQPACDSYLNVFDVGLCADLSRRFYAYP